MKTRQVLFATILTLLAGAAYAGLTQPAPVEVDLDNFFAQGDQYTARTDENDEVFIGCGYRVFDDGVNSFLFGFCQATDAEGDTVTCFTQKQTLIDAMRGTSDYAYITFNWQDDGFGGADCTRVGFSTQSFYLPKPSHSKKKRK